MSFARHPGDPPVWLAHLFSPDFSGICTREGAVTSLFWEVPTRPLACADPDLLQKMRAWLGEYGRGHFRPVDFPLAPEGTVFQKRLWQQVRQIAPGHTITYGHLAQVLRSAPRAVGQGVGANPLPLVIPCHRVVAARGLWWFSALGGVDTKRWLLSWEKRAG